MSDRALKLRSFDGQSSALGLALALLTIIMVRTAWLTDDAYIMLRTADNWIGGYGLRWNVAERVQSYTHPLWLFLVSGAYSVTREVYYTLIVLSLVVSLAAVLILCRQAATRASALISVVLLAVSKAFIDYSTSGLENPLAHLLLVIFWAVYLGSQQLTDMRLAVLAMLSGLVALTRLDLFLMVVPVLAYLALRAWRLGRFDRWWRLTALGLAPILAWELFSMVYYGVPFPNTAYAKLGNTGQSSLSTVSQGWYYLAQSFRVDPFTMSTILVASIWVTWRGRSDLRWMFVGLLFYLIYVVAIGGDFMSGRLLTAVFWGAVVILSTIRWSFWPAFAVGQIVILTSLFGIPSTPLLASPEDEVSLHQEFRFHRGIADERAYYAKRNSLWSGQRTAARYGWVDRRDELSPSVLPHESGGMVAFQAGPAVHVIDHLGLSEPLLARLPSRAVISWRVGHVEREIPSGYVETIATGQNSIRDPALAEYYERLRIVIGGPLFTCERWLAIWQLNTGRLDYLLELYEPSYIPP